MLHPNKKLQKQQEKFLNKFPADERDSHAQIFSIGNAAFNYHQEAWQTTEKSLRSYYNEWLEGLPANIRENMEKQGFEKCLSMLPFTRYVNERNDVGMDEKPSIRRGF